MATGRRIAVRVALFAAAAMIVPLNTVHAQSCTPQDWWNALSSAASALTSGDCAAACGDTGGTGCTAAVAVAGALGGVAAGNGQGSVGQFCSQVTNLQNASGKLSSIQSWLSAAGISQDVTSTILGALDQIGDPLSVAQCGCSLEQGIDQLGGQLVSCLQGAICGLQQDFGWGGCSCTPPAPVSANCTPPLSCATTNPSDPQCGNVLLQTPGVNPQPVQIKQLPDGGWFVIDNTDGWDGHSQYCAPDSYCSCPSPMTLKTTPVSGSGDGTVMLSCGCPTAADRNNDPSQSTHPMQPSGPLAEVCICDSTGQPAVPPDWGQGPSGGNNLNPTHSICPTPLTGIPCPIAGQVRVSNNKCVAPCSNPHQVMTPDGACCDPNQVAACGQCCPPGMTPNLVKGDCERNETTQ